MAVKSQLVGAEQEKHVHGGQHGSPVDALGAGHEAEVKAADTRCGRVQDGKTVPAFGHGADIDGELCGACQNTRAIRAGKRALADDDQRRLGLRQHLGEGMVAIHQILQRIGTSTEIFVIITQVTAFADHADREAAAAPALADAGIEHGSLEARVRADNQQRISLFDAFDRRVEEVACTAERRIKCRPILATVEVLGTERLHQFGERVHFLDRSEVAGDRADLFAGRLGNCGLDRRRRLPPRSRAAGGRPCGHRAGPDAASSGRPR